jgi:hypothetical protein
MQVEHAIIPSAVFPYCGCIRSVIIARATIGKVDEGLGMAVSLDVGVANQHPLVTPSSLILVRLYSVRCKE